MCNHTVMSLVHAKNCLVIYIKIIFRGLMCWKQIFLGLNENRVYSVFRKQNSFLLPQSLTPQDPHWHCKLFLWWESWGCWNRRCAVRAQAQGHRAPCPGSPTPNSPALHPAAFWLSTCGPQQNGLFPPTTEDRVLILGPVNMWPYGQRGN